MGPRLARCLDAVSGWLRGRLPDVMLRAYDRDCSPPVVVLSDAMFRPPDIGHGAFVVWVPSTAGPGGYLAFADGAASPEVIAAVRKLREQKTLIMPLEAMSMGAPYFCAEILGSIEGRDVLHFADNTAANSGVVRGYSAAADLARIAGAMHDQWSILGIDPWVEYVSSASNLADLPSRCEYSWLLKHGARRVTWRFPPTELWEDVVSD